MTTPQLAAQEVAERAGSIALQTHQQIVGVVENMSWWEQPDGSRVELFGSGGGTAVAASLSQLTGTTVPLLGQVPIDQRLREGGDAGVPIVASDAGLAGRGGAGRDRRQAGGAAARARRPAARPQPRRPLTQPPAPPLSGRPRHSAAGSATQSAGRAAGRPGQPLPEPPPLPPPSPPPLPRPLPPVVVPVVVVPPVC